MTYHDVVEQLIEAHELSKDTWAQLMVLLWEGDISNEAWHDVCQELSSLGLNHEEVDFVENWYPGLSLSASADIDE